MTPANLKDATRVVGQDQGYIGLPVRDETINCSVNGQGTPCMMTEWELTPEERSRLFLGGRVRIRILGTIHPPIVVEVE